MFDDRFTKINWVIKAAIVLIWLSTSRPSVAWARSETTNIILRTDRIILTILPFVITMYGPVYVNFHRIRSHKRELGSQAFPTAEEGESLPRPRSGTWNNKSDAKKDKSDKGKAKKDKGKDGKKKEKQQAHTGSRSGSASRSNSAERRKSDEGPSPQKEDSRSRSNSDVSKKKGSIFLTSMKAAMLYTGLMHPKSKDGSAHPVAATDSSDTRYYHTVTAASNRSPMTKVMDIFRTKPAFQSEEEIIKREERREERKKEERREEERRKREEKEKREEKRREEERKRKEKNMAIMHNKHKGPRDGSAHPVRDSDNMYYHTVTAASSNKSPMTKVMDIFRNRTHASVPPEDRRKKANHHLGK
ncbi:hypothetical protein GWI33_016919 [Rhynchophorus ferrugineus]|uniref:Uncharacterized protein n=1 Tax=Rhynchophorus ferrugineus TaxID=354439 RepID=A0A834IA76_RHYFE|nr:hypothetical protein GWI33_016919 [Rhynchophorus ferrugineus]